MASAFGAPSPGNLVLPTTVQGTYVFEPLGTATFTEVGLVTFAALPAGGFAPSSTNNTFVASFDGGANTFNGTNLTVFGPPNVAGFPTFTSTITILGGTGIFSGASGFGSSSGISFRDPGAIAPSPVTPVSSLGSGQITTPAVTAAPEPGTVALLGAGLTGIAVLRKRRRFV